MKKTEVSILKPDLAAAAASFAIGAQQEPISSATPSNQGGDIQQKEKRLKTPSKQVSGLVPPGDVRLTANISEAHHIKLKVAAAQQRTTIGELLEALINKGLS